MGGTAVRKFEGQHNIKEAHFAGMPGILPRFYKKSLNNPRKRFHDVDLEVTNADAIYEALVNNKTLEKLRLAVRLLHPFKRKVFLTNK